MLGRGRWRTDAASRRLHVARLDPGKFDNDQSEQSLPRCSPVSVPVSTVWRKEFRRLVKLWATWRPPLWYCYSSFVQSNVSNKLCIITTGNCKIKPWAGFQQNIDILFSTVTSYEITLIVYLSSFNRWKWIMREYRQAKSSNRYLQYIIQTKKKSCV